MKAKQIVYVYNGKQDEPDIEIDRDGEVTIKQSDIIQRKGKSWKVIHLIVEQSVTDAQQVPVHRVFLTDQF